MSNNPGSIEQLKNLLQRNLDKASKIVEEILFELEKKVSYRSNSKIEEEIEKFNRIKEILDEK